MNYYNDHDPRSCAWIKEMIEAGVIPKGIVDERSITEVKPSDLVGFTQCHFFAGIGGWSYALRLAGWPDNRPVWTGSCPCQPFSLAGKRLGEKDHRHLWPEFRRLIQESLPPVVFGEQVAKKPGRRWLSGVRADLETIGYAVGASDLCAAGVGAPHIRQRIYWVADLCSSGLERRKEQPTREECQAAQRSGATVRMGDAMCCGQQEHEERDSEKRCWPQVQPRPDARGPSFWSDYSAIKCRDGKTRRVPAQPAFQPLVDGIQPGRTGLLRGAGNAIVPQVAAEFINSARPFLINGW